MTSPYVYAFDNLICHIDQDGMYGEDVVEDFEGEGDPKPKQTASVGALTIGGSILRGLAALTEGVKIVGLGTATAVAGTIALAVWPQNGNSAGADDINNWNLKPVLPPPIVPNLKNNNSSGNAEAKKTSSEPSTTPRGTAGKLEKSPAGPGTVPPAERETKSSYS